MNMSEQGLATHAADPKSVLSMTEQLVALHGARRHPCAPSAQPGIGWTGSVRRRGVPRARRASHAALGAAGMGGPKERPWPALAAHACTDMQAVWLDAGLANIQEMVTCTVKPSCIRGGRVARRGACGAPSWPGYPEALDAVVRGYEASVRVGRALGPAHYALWHNTATLACSAGDRSRGCAGAGRCADGVGAGQCRYAGGGTVAGAPGAVMSKQLHTAMQHGPD